MQAVTIELCTSNLLELFIDQLGLVWNIKLRVITVIQQEEVKCRNILTNLKLCIYGRKLRQLVTGKCYYAHKNKTLERFFFIMLMSKCYTLYDSFPTFRVKVPIIFKLEDISLFREKLKRLTICTSNTFTILACFERLQKNKCVMTGSYQTFICSTFISNAVHTFHSKIIP